MWTRILGQAQKSPANETQPLGGAQDLGVSLVQPEAVSAAPGRVIQPLPQAGAWGLEDSVGCGERSPHPS